VADASHTLLFAGRATGGDCAGDTLKRLRSARIYIDPLTLQGDADGSRPELSLFRFPSSFFLSYEFQSSGPALEALTRLSAGK
jgi:hypothetical protein